MYVKRLCGIGCAALGAGKKPAALADEIRFQSFYVDDDDDGIFERAGGFVRKSVRHRSATAPGARGKGTKTAIRRKQLRSESRFSALERNVLPLIETLSSVVDRPRQRRWWSMLSSSMERAHGDGAKRFRKPR